MVVALDFAAIDWQIHQNAENPSHRDGGWVLGVYDGFLGGTRYPIVGAGIYGVYVASNMYTAEVQ